MKRRQALQTMARGVEGLAVLPLVARANPYEFEFLHAGWDTEGNYFPLSECVDAANTARLPLPVYDDANWGRNVASHIVALRMDGERMIATLDRLPENLDMKLGMAATLLMGAFQIIYGIFTLRKVGHVPTEDMMTVPL